MRTRADVLLTAPQAAALSPAPPDFDALLDARVRRMRYGDSVILSLPNGTMKMIELKQGGCVLGSSAL